MIFEEVKSASLFKYSIAGVDFSRHDYKYNDAPVVAATGFTSEEIKEAFKLYKFTCGSGLVHIVEGVVLFFQGNTSVEKYKKYGRVIYVLTDDSTKTFCGIEVISYE